MKEFELTFYKKANGDCPVSEFLLSLNNVMRNKMLHQMELLEMFGNQPKGDYSKYVSDGIFEIRAQTKTDITRILFFFGENKEIVLTNGFVKKTQKIPASEVETAMRYRADFWEQMNVRTMGNTKQASFGHPSNRRPRLDDIVREAEKGSASKKGSKSKGKKPYQR